MSTIFTKYDSKIEVLEARIVALEKELHAALADNAVRAERLSESLNGLRIAVDSGDLPMGEGATTEITHYLDDMATILTEPHSSTAPLGELQEARSNLAATHEQWAFEKGLAEKEMEALRTVLHVKLGAGKSDPPAVIAEAIDRYAVRARNEGRAQAKAHLEHAAERRMRGLMRSAARNPSKMVAQLAREIATLKEPEE